MRFSKSLSSLCIFISLISCQSDEFIKETLSIEAYLETTGDTKTDMNYQSILLDYVDTFTVADKKRLLAEEIEAVKRELLEYNKPVATYLVEIQGNIFSKDFLTREKVVQIRNWERENRKQAGSSRGDYYEFVFSEDCFSEWCVTLRNQLNETDQFLEGYDKIEDSNLKFIKNITWYYKRIDQYNSNGASDSRWDALTGKINDAIEKEEELLSLSNREDNVVIHYVIKNKYTIVNPLLNNAKQEIERKFILNAEKDEILGMLE